MGYPFRVWDFGDSVYLDALLALADADAPAGPEFSAFAYGMAKAWAAHTRYDFADHVAPGAALVGLWRRTGDDGLLASAVQLAGLWQRFPRCVPAEGYLHTFTKHRNISVDCAHFDGPYFAQLALATGDVCYAEQAVYELSWRLRLLQDETHGLCHHSYDGGRGRRNPVLWGRGQGWALLGLVETLSALDPATDGCEELRQRLRLLVDGLLDHQADGGGWHTVVDDDTSYVESSTAAFFVAAVPPAIDAALLPVDERLTAAVRRAWAATRAATRPDGLLDGVSGNTLSTLSPAGYRAVPVGGCYPWGQGPLVLAALAARTLPGGPVPG